MKRRWKKFLAGVLSAAFVLNLAAPLALAGSSTMGAACGVTNVLLYPEWNGPVDSKKCIQGTVSYNRGLLTFDGDVTLDTTSDPYNSSLVEALSEKNLRLVANGKVTGSTNSDGFDGAKEIVRGKYDLTNTYWNNTSKGISGGDTGTTIASDTEITLKGFQTGIGWGSVQIDGKVKISSAAYGIANFTTMNHGSELVIHAQQYIGEQGHLTYNGGHLLLNVNDVLSNGTVSYDPAAHTLTLKQADLTLGEDANFTYCIDSELTDMLTITGTATLSNADGIITAGPLTLKDATLTFTGNINEDVGDDAIRAGRSDEDITIQNSTVTIAGTNSEGNFFQFGIRCGKLTVANSTLDVKANSSAIVVADEMKVSGVNTIVMAETGASEEEDDYALKLDNENSLTMNDGLVLVEGEVNKSKKAKIARSEQAPTNYLAYWVVRPGDEAEPSMQIPGAITSSDFVGWFLEDGTRLEDSPYYMGPDADYVGNLDRDVTFYGHWRTAESDEGGGDGGDGGDGFGTLLAVGAVVGVAGVVAYQVGTELILDQLLPAGVAVPHTRAELAMLLWNTAGRPAPATLPAFADVADPELAQAAQWAIEQGYLKARADGSFKPDKGVAKWRVIRGYRAVTEP